MDVHTRIMGRVLLPKWFLFLTYAEDQSSTDLFKQNRDQINKGGKQKNTFPFKHKQRVVKFNSHE